MKNMREDKTNPVYLSKYSEFSKEDIIAIIDDLLEKAKHLSNTKIVFELTLEPYEDCCPGPAKVYVSGFRPLTKEEIEADQKEEELYILAKEMGVTVYEARIFRDLKQRGKI